MAALLLIILAGAGCTAPDASTFGESSSAVSDRDFVEIIKQGYVSAGKEKLFEKIALENNFAMMSCKEGEFIEISPKKFVGLDGGINYLVDRSLKSAESVFDEPTECTGVYRIVSYP